VLTPCTLSFSYSIWKKRKEKERMDKEWLLFCVLHHPMDAETHNIPPGENVRSFSAGVRWLGGRGLHTTRSIAQIFVEVVFNVSSHLYSLVADLIACRLYVSMGAVACRPVTPRLWSGFLVWRL
jgi:hypothetical protein